MQTLLLFVLGLFCLGTLSLNNAGTKVNESIEESSISSENKEVTSTVHWIDISILDRMMARKPKKVMIVIYSESCGWCKTMDKMAFSHPDLTQDINSDFYAVRWRANGNDPVEFQGQNFSKAIPDYNKLHPFTYYLMERANQAQVGYPAVVFLDEHLTVLAAYLGYKDANQIDVLCRYYGENHYHNMGLPNYRQQYPSSIPPDVYSTHMRSGK